MLASALNVRDIKARGYRTPARALAVARRYRRRFPSVAVLLTRHEFAVAPWLFEVWRVTFEPKDARA